MNTRLKLLTALNAFLVFSSIMHGQGAGYHDRVLNSRGRPVAGRTVIVCSVPATVGSTGSCTPAVNTFTDAALTLPAGGQAAVRINRLGNFQFYLAPGNYCYTVTGLGMINTSSNTCYPFSLAAAPATLISSCATNGVYIVGPPCYSTVQDAISAACMAGGGTVFMPSGSWPNNVPFKMCSNLNLLGAGWGQPDVANCPTTITTTMTSGDLFPVTNMADIHLADFCIKNTAAAGANAAIRLNYGQRVVAERIYIYGPFAAGIQLNTSSTSAGSTIWNDFRDIHISGLASGGVGCLLDSTDATSKVINNNYFYNVNCTGGTNGVGIKLTNTAKNQIINENVFFSGEITASGGTAFLLTEMATRGVTCVECNIEGSTTGFSKAKGNTAIFVAGNLSANTTDVVDDQAAFTSFLNTSVGGVVQQWSVSPQGGMNIDGLGLNGSAVSNSINGAPGWTLKVSSSTVATVNAGSLALTQPLDNASTVFANLGTPADGRQVYCSNCKIAKNCTSGGTGAFAKRINGAWVCN
ncbi:MAG TPA: hypothetical protein VG759_19840 [Candidatus Angelobacter sp.]|jgi:hypothetical protein|nr:hypothetical protein [Candidatus Angelobacter sp.]